MNITLILMTILTSAADSLNPVAITQQFVLQGIVRKPRHIWYFICATYITNFIGGMMVYYGLMTMISNLWSRISKASGAGLYIVELIIGIIILIFAIRNFIKLRVKAKTSKNYNKESEEAAVKANIKSVSPASLFVLGTAATIMELTSAFPYFAFLGVLLNYRLSLPVVFFIQALYNLIYASPLILLYFIYCKKQMLFDRVYDWVKHKMEKLSDFVSPILLAAVGMFLIFHAANLMFF